MHRCDEFQRGLQWDVALFSDSFVQLLNSQHGNYLVVNSTTKVVTVFLPVF